MRSIKRVVLGALLLVLALLFIAFVLENHQSTSLQLFGWSTPQLPMAVYIILALLVGMAIGPLLCQRARLRDRKGV